MKDFDAKEFLANSKNFSDFPTRIAVSANEDDKEDKLEKIRKKIGKIQEKMYAHNRYSMLICLQGMDTSGKDSLIRELFKDVNARGVTVQSFKTPNSTELEHDYLWRHYIALPEKGKIGVFNRSHYENVLVTRVHPEYLLNENLPDILDVSDVTPEFWMRRYEQIRNFEAHLAENGMIILKFYLNMSKEEQRQRLLRRLEEEKHNWKFSVGDLKEREKWDNYMQFYDEAISNTSTEKAPWYIVPADDKDLARVIVGSIILEELEKYNDIDEPELEDEVKENISKYRHQLENEA